MSQARSRTGRSLAGPLAGLLLLGACAAQPEPARVRARRAAIIGGEPAPEAHAVAMVAHRDRRSRCSGALISERLLVTAAHCAFSEDAEQPGPLSADGFRVAFGASDAQSEERYVERLDLIEQSADGGLAAAVERGEDVAVLWLSEPAPISVVPLALAQRYEPQRDEPVLMLGFGISSLQSGENGTRRRGEATVTGLEPDTGLVQLAGASACLGDSGGPLLRAASGELIGVIGQVASSADASVCDLGLSFAYTIANPRVRRLLTAACRLNGGCGPRPGGAVDLDAALSDAAQRPEDAAADAAHHADAMPDSGYPADASPSAARDADNEAGSLTDDAGQGCDCRIAQRRGRSALAPALLLFSALVWRVQRRFLTGSSALPHERLMKRSASG